MSFTRIPVADTPLDELFPSRAPAVKPGIKSPGSDEVRPAIQRSYSALLALTLLTFFSLFMWAIGPALTILIVLHYLLWPSILLGLAYHLSRRGSEHLARTLLILCPFAIIGTLSGMTGFNPIISARALTFWIFGMVAAAIIGGELPPDKVRKNLFWFFTIVLILSILLAIFYPRAGLSGDKRAFAGAAWRGVFVQKNTLGSACALATAVLISADTVKWLFRVAFAMLIGVCLLFSSSMGGVVTSVAVIGFVSAVGYLRRSEMSVGLQSLVLLTGVILVVAAVMIGTPQILALLGRDPTLTGRSEIWAVFFERALYFWLKGAGPGSFSDSSPITVDLSILFHNVGLVDTPHEKYIAILGEVGIFGLLIFICTVGYFVFILPLINRHKSALPTAAVAFTMMISGLVETGQVYGINPSMFLVVLMFSSLRYEERISKITADQSRDLANPQSPPSATTQWTGPKVLG